MTAFLHFDKVMQIPLIVLHDVCGVSYRDLFEAFLEERADRFPIISEIKQFFIKSAHDIQRGGPEYTHSSEWLDIYWPTDEYIMIKLCVENKLTGFYSEAETLAAEFLKARFLQLPPKLLHEAIELNRKLIKLPFQTGDLEFETSYNIWEFYCAALVGERIQLEERPCVNRIVRTKVVYNSWDDWYREVIWYGNKKGAYLYGNDTVERELAGHY